MRVFFGMLVVCTGFLLPRCSTIDGQDNVAKGRAVFIEHCMKCHGVRAVGQDPANPDGKWVDERTHIAPALNGSGHAWHHPPELFFQYIKQGMIDGESPMPIYGIVLSDDQILQVIDYLQSLWPDEMRKNYRRRYRESDLFEA